MWLAFGTLTRELRDGEVIVGSGADADWRVATADLLPRHLAITIHGLNASLKQATRDAVVVVNGRQLIGGSHLLNEGDVVEAGSGRFLFADDEPRVEPLPPRTDVAYLLDERAQVAWPLTNRSTTIGRDGSNTIVLRDPSASRFHAEVRREAGGFALHSMGSAGTKRNGRPIESPVMLQQDDTIGIAHGEFRFAVAIPAGFETAAVQLPPPSPAERSPTISTGVWSAEPPRRPRSRVWLVALVVALAAVAVAAMMIAGRS